RDDASTNSGADGVTVASNLPTGDAEGAANQSSAQRSEMRESLTFDMSETQREIAREPGSIRRISVAVLLNGVPQVAGDGRAQLVPRSEEELRALETLVQSAVGFDAARGDSVTVQSMVFDEAARPEMLEAGLFENLQFDLGRLIQTLVLSGVALAIAFGLIRPMMRGTTASVAIGDGAAALPYMSGRSADALPGPEADLPLGDDSEPVDLGSMPDFPQIAFPGLDNSFGASDPLDQDPVTRLKRLIEEREEETVDILRSWMDEDEEGKVR
ncbi:MAG: flagellar M-ring protein FliF C-terminal domain-containing protein, partial [Parvularcula sp.]|nr:flagellar M-ring protein FliF C-terminal domain-containing protein [Parvularcula sp.]